MVKGYVVYTLILLFSLSILIHPAMALPITAIPFVSTDNVAFINPFSISAVGIKEFNSASILSQSAENLNISFPLLNDDSVLGPSTFRDGAVSSDTGVEGLQTSNALPFGPVSLAFPAIDQTTYDNTAAQSTYFFSDIFT